MASRLLLLVCAALATTAQCKEAKRSPSVAPSQILYGTAEIIGDIYSHVYDALDKTGVPAQVKAQTNKLLTEDPIALACSKIGCKKKDITDALAKPEAVILQVKAQGYELKAKASDALDGVAASIVAQFEKHVPSYKGVLPNNILDLFLVIMYFAFVFYVTLRITLFVIRTALSIFCCVCCCGCCRRGTAAASKGGKNSGKKAGADAKATPTKAKGKK